MELVFWRILLCVFLEILDLIHNLPENVRNVFGWIFVLGQADFYLQLQCVADALIVQPVRERRFCIDNFFYLLRQRFAFVVQRRGF